MSYKARESRESSQTEGYVVGYSPELMCCAHGCPNRWSVDPPRACSAHAWADPHDWPRITREQLDAEIERDFAKRAPKETQRFVTPNAEKLHRYLSQLAHGIRIGGADPKAWAYVLKEREEAGERLTEFQKQAWREVCK